MEPRNRDQWIKIIEKNVQELHDRINNQQNVMFSILGRINTPPPSVSCSTSDCRYKTLFHRVLLETIEVLEKTKKSFKSTQLEELRKRLTEILKETV